MSDLQPGRDLDAMVAEKVMGCTVYVEANGNPRCDCNGPNAPGPRPHAGPGLFASLARYSTDMAAAWEVVEKMEADGFTVEYRTHGPRDKRRCVILERVDAGRIKGYGDADTAPHAICLAALRAVGAIP